MPNRMLRAAAALAAIGFVTACQAPSPTAANSAAPEVAAPTPDAQASAPVATREAQQIVVERGQSLSRIAAKYGIGKRAIVAANNLTPPYKIKIGQHLVIPGDTAPAPAVAASARPEPIPLDPPARTGSTTQPASAPPPAVAVVSVPPPDAPAVTSVELAAPADAKSPAPSPAPVAPAVATTGAPPPPAEPTAAAATVAAPAPAPAPAAAAEAPPPGVTCPFGTTGMWSEDVIKKPVYICRRPQSQG